VSHLSVGAKWTLRYTAALLVAVSLFAAYTYARIDRRLRQDARLFLELQVDEVVEAIATRSADAPSVREGAARSTLIASSDLKLGLAVFGANGQLLHAHGSLITHPVDPPNWLENTEERRLVQELDFGESQNYPYLVLSKLLPDGTMVQGALYTRRFIRNARDVRDIYFWALPLALVGTLALGSWLVRGSLRPIAQITRTARQFSGTRSGDPIPTTGSGDELDELAQTVNEMMARIHRSVARMQRFSANAAHELRTPLNALRSRLEVTLEQDRSLEEYRKILAETAAEVEGLSESVQAMMKLAQSEAGLREEDRVTVAVDGLLREVCEFFEPLASEQGLSLVLGELESAAVSGEPAWLRQCFANLVDNAIRYTPEDGTITVECTSEQGGQAVAVRVRDTGSGIPESELTRIFEPYHRVRIDAVAKGRGAGIGLALVREIARAHGGEVSVESALEKGSVFTVRLPAAHES
jgi:heavy metal sensor kinase